MKATVAYRRATLETALADADTRAAGMVASPNAAALTVIHGPREAVPPAGLAGEPIGFAAYPDGSRVYTFSVRTVRRLLAELHDARESDGLLSAEEDAFINGEGDDRPRGILDGWHLEARSPIGGESWPSADDQRTYPTREAAREAAERADRAHLLAIYHVVEGPHPGAAV